VSGSNWELLETLAETLAWVFPFNYVNWEFHHVKCSGTPTSVSIIERPATALTYSSFLFWVDCSTDRNGQLHITHSLGTVTWNVKHEWQRYGKLHSYSKVLTICSLSALTFDKWQQRQPVGFLLKPPMYTLSFISPLAYTSVLHNFESNSFHNLRMKINVVGSQSSKT
jgi:hypothetical protein